MGVHASCVYVGLLSSVCDIERLKVKDLQQFLKDRGVPCAGYQRKDLVNMCKLAVDVDVEVDPDGLQEDVNVITANKLQLDNGDCLPIPDPCPPRITARNCR